MVSKGKVSTVTADGTRVTVAPYSGGLVTPELAVPFFLVGLLEIGTPVFYTVYEDNSGIIVHRADGAGTGTGSGGGDGDDETDVSASIENNVLVITAPEGSGASAYVKNGVLYVTQGAEDNMTAFVRDGVLVMATVGGSDGPLFKVDDTLVWSEDGVLSVNTADEVEKDNTRPITSAAVHTTVGNIEVLLSLI